MSPRADDTVTEQTGVLRRLARSLLYDRSAADDAVQEAWLLALRKHPDRPLSVGGWLRGVVRNVSRQSIREKSRRDRREAASATPEATAPAVDTAARLELMRKVADAVERLEEPYRETVMRRFFDDQKPGRIAREMGVPVETVRTRLKRALARMRVGLDAAVLGPVDPGDDRDSRRALLGALVPLAGRAPLAVVLGAGTAGGLAALTASTSSVAGAGAVLMGKKTIVAAAVAVIGAAGFFFHDAGTPRVDEGSGPAVEETARAPDRVVESGAVQPVDESSAETRVAEPSGGAAGAVDWSVSGRAFTSDRRLFPGARVSVTIRPADGTDPAEHVVVADAAGRFVWTGPGPAVGAWVTLGSGAEGVFSYGHHTWVPPGAPGVDGLYVYLRPIDCEVHGRVTDAGRRPIAGAEVWSLYGRATSAEDGTFVVPGSSVASSDYVHARAAGYAQVRVSVDAPAPGRIDGVEIALRDQFTIHGRVTDPTGAPVAGASVSSIFLGAAPVETDAAGEYVLAHLDPARKQWLVHVSADGWRTAESWVDSRGGASVEHDVELTRGVTVGGRVVDGRGAAVGGVHLSLGAFEGDATSVTALTNADGSFVLRSAPSGSLVLSASRSGFGRASRAVEVPEAGLDGVEVVVEEGRSLGGTVVDASGRPVDGALVQALVERDVVAPNAIADEAGTFALRDLPADVDQVRVFARGYRRFVADVARLDEDDLVLRLEAEARIGGRVVDAATGAPVTRFTVRLVDPQLHEGEIRMRPNSTWTREGHTFESATGEWTGWVGAGVGEVIGVEVSAPGYARRVARRVVALAGDEPFTLVSALERGARIVGHVVRRGADLPIEGAVVKAYAADEVRWSFDDDGIHTRRMATTDAHGLFVIESVPPGPTRLSLALPDGETVEDGPFDVPRAGAVERRIEVATPGRLTGSVVDAAGRSVGGAQVVAIEFGPGGESSRDHSTETNGEGRFAFDGLPGGTYVVLWRERVGGVSASLLAETVSFGDGEAADVTLRPRGRGRIEGTVALPEGVASVAVEALQMESIVPGDPASYAKAMRGAVAVDGRFTIVGVTPGTWSLKARVVRDGASVEATAEVEVTGVGAAEVELTFDRP